jgi:signal transduction histidine kinase
VSQQADPVEVSSEIEALRAKADNLTLQLTEEHKMASIGRLLASIVHEINSPIGSILSNNHVITRSLELLKAALAAGDAASFGKANRLVETSLALTAVDKIACERISEVVRGLKTFARVDSPSSQGEFERYSGHTGIDTRRVSSAHCIRRTDFGELARLPPAPAQSYFRIFR